MIHTVKDVPSLEAYLHVLGPIPGEAVVLGMAQDKMPVLFNTNDRNMPSTLIERGRPVLQTMAKHISIAQNPSLECVVFSNNPFGKTSAKIWEMPGCIEFIQNWAKSPRSGSLIVMVDDLDEVYDLDQKTIDSFLWIVRNGKKNRVHVVASCERCVNTAEFGILIQNEGQEYKYIEGKDREVRFYAL